MFVHIKMSKKKKTKNCLFCTCSVGRYCSRVRLAAFRERCGVASGNTPPHSQPHSKGPAPAKAHNTDSSSSPKTPLELGHWFLILLLRFQVFS